ncbi:hypothetical protein Hanom_Chr09g00823901 [Helianthus anomalus]
MSAMTWRGERMGGSQLGLSRPSHARLESQAPRATPQLKPTRGGGLGIYPQPTPQRNPIPNGLTLENLPINYSTRCNLVLFL